MPHARNRYLIHNLLKKLKFFPVVAIQGARQTGKSFLAREILPKYLNRYTYISFDDSSILKKAKKSPLTFLRGFERNQVLIIDEAQKVPEIFDAIKLIVDNKRIPGSYLLLGSTEFSHMALIRESLTGRMGRVRLFPFTLTENLNLPQHFQKVEREDLIRYLKNGGMPGIFSIRSSEQRSALIQDWLDLICLRDIHQFKKLKLDSDLCYQLVKLSAALYEPTRAMSAKETGEDSRKVETHLNVLCELFVFVKLNPHPSGTGKPIYLPMDCGIANYLNASDERLLQIWLINERLANAAYGSAKKTEFYYYRSTGKKIIPLLEVTLGKKPKAYQVIDFENIKKTDAELINAFLRKNVKFTGAVFAPITLSDHVNEIAFHPWENLLTF